MFTLSLFVELTKHISTNLNTDSSEHSCLRSVLLNNFLA